MVAAYWLRVLFNELFIEIFIGFITSHLFNNYIFLGQSFLTRNAMGLWPVDHLLFWPAETVAACAE